MLSDHLWPGSNPARVVTAARLAGHENSYPIRPQDVQPGDIAVFKHSFGTGCHVALVTHTADDQQITIAHSTRQHHGDVGGVEQHGLSRRSMHYPDHHHRGLGRLSLRRLYALGPVPDAA